MAVRAKFKVSEVTNRGNGYGAVKLNAVTGHKSDGSEASEENKSFWQYTPAGTITISIDNEAALKQFSPGDEFYVDFNLIPLQNVPG